MSRDFSGETAFDPDDIARMTVEVAVLVHERRSASPDS
jgi:hypothetical protein